MKQVRGHGNTWGMRLPRVDDSIGNALHNTADFDVYVEPELNDEQRERLEEGRLKLIEARDIFRELQEELAR
jgi:hypothetical protein